MYTNVDNSLTSKLDELQAEIAISEPDIICLTEAKPKNGQVPDKEILNLNSYDLFLNPAFNDEDTRGVCIYVKQYLNARAVETNITKSFKDSAWLEISGRNKKLLMSTVYRSGSPDKAKLLDNDLHNTIKKMSLSKEYSQIVISGDFNHPAIKWTETLGEDGDNLVIPELSRQHNPDHHDVAFLECLNDSLLLQHVTKPTRYRDDQQPTLDDLILTSDDHTINNLKYKPHLGNSDHIMLSFDVCFQFDKPKQVPKTRYNYQKTDVAKMNDMLNKDWSSELEGKSPEEAYNSFLETYTLAVEECVPKSITMVDNKYIKPIWMKADTLRLIKKKHNSHTRYLNTKQKADKAAYKVIRL